MNTSNKKTSDDQDHLNILRKIDKNSDITQRKLANELGISLGKLNYLLIELKKKGLVKINNFKKNPKKLNYIYLLTPRGIAIKTKLTISFMNRKLKEYDELKIELEKFKEK
tara:strand:+ start:834 stop:1166 length:333 start_codon:yes stop_codon:yes gene_type:complete